MVELLLNRLSSWTMPARTLVARAQQGARASMGAPLQMTLGLIKPTVCSYQPDVSAVLKEIKAQATQAQIDLQVVRQKRLFFKTGEAEAFYAQHKGKFYYDRLIASMTR